jgi:uncharacterized protein Yka (UPF0111/DUF47 family)
MDDAIDQMNQTAKAITLYELKTFEPQMRDMSGIIVEAARDHRRGDAAAPRPRPNGTRMLELTERIVELEGHADEIHDAGPQGALQGSGDKAPMEFIVGREIYSHLEKIVDRFEDVANEIQGLVLDHA